MPCSIDDRNALKKRRERANTMRRPMQGTYDSEYVTVIRTVVNLHVAVEYIHLLTRHGEVNDFLELYVLFPSLGR